MGQFHPLSIELGCVGTNDAGKAAREPRHQCSPMRLATRIGHLALRSVRDPSPKRGEGHKTVFLWSCIDLATHDRWVITIFFITAVHRPVHSQEGRGHRPVAVFTVSPGPNHPGDGRGSSTDFFTIFHGPIHPREGGVTDLIFFTVFHSPIHPGDGGVIDRLL